MRLHADQLRKLAGVIAQLGNDELGPGRNLAAQFGVLGKALAFGLFKGRDGAAAEKAVRVAGRPDALAEHAQHDLQLDRIDIEHRRALPAEAFARIVAVEGQYVFKPHSRQLQGAALHAHPIHVAAGEVDDHVHADHENVVTQCVRAQRRGCRRDCR